MNLTRLAAALESRIGVVAVRWSVRILFFLSVLAWFVMGADGPADPRFADEDVENGSAAPARTPVDGFGEVAFRVDPAPGLDAARPRCALEAAEDAQRVKGMQNRSDFAGYDGMLFLFDRDSQAQFVNHFVPIGLSIAWFDGDGRFVSSADMPPCPSGVNCPRYSATGSYRTALEVPIGRLPDLGIAEGAVLTHGGPCPTTG